MANFGLWWVRWNGSGCESRMINGRDKTGRLGDKYA